jgi:hypothetical protein
MKGLCFKVFLCFLSIGIPYYKEGHVNEVKIIKSSDSKSFPKLSQTELLARHCLALPEIASIHHRKPPPDVVQNLNLGPTTRFLRELYIYPYISNDSPLLAFGFYC